MTDKVLLKLIEQKQQLDDQKNDVLEKTLIGIIDLCDRIDKIENDIKIIKKLISLNDKRDEYEKKYKDIH